MSDIDDLLTFITSDPLDENKESSPEPYLANEQSDLEQESFDEQNASNIQQKDLHQGSAETPLPNESNSKKKQLSTYDSATGDKETHEIYKDPASYVPNEPNYESFQFATDFQEDIVSGTEFEDAWAVNKELKEKLEMLKRRTQKKEEELNELQEQEASKMEMVMQCQTAIETAESKQQELCHYSNSLKIQLKYLEDHRNRCNQGNRSRQEAFKNKKLTDQVRRVSTKLGELVRRDKEFDFQRGRLHTDIEKLEGTKLQREQQIEHIEDRAAELQSKVVALQSVYKKKSDLVSALSQELEEIEDMPITSPGTTKRNRALTREIIRKIDAKDNEIFMMNEMIKTWNTQFLKKSTISKRLQPNKRISADRLESLPTDKGWNSSLRDSGATKYSKSTFMTQQSISHRSTLPRMRNRSNKSELRKS